MLRKPNLVWKKNSIGLLYSGKNILTAALFITVVSAVVHLVTQPVPRFTHAIGTYKVVLLTFWGKKTFRFRFVLYNKFGECHINPK